MENEATGATGRTLGDPIVVTEDVKKWFGDFQALKGVTARLATTSNAPAAVVVKALPTDGSR